MKVLSQKINKSLAKADGFISRDAVRAEDGTMSCILKWKSKEQQERFNEAIMTRTDEESLAMRAEFERIVNIESMTKKTLEIL